MVLVLVHVLDLLRRNLFFGVLLHNAVAHTSSCTRVSTGGRKRLEQPLLLHLDLLTDLGFVLSLDLPVVQSVPVDVLEERVLFDLVDVVCGAQTRRLITIEELNETIRVNLL